MIAHYRQAQDTAVSFITQGPKGPSTSNILLLYIRYTFRYAYDYYTTKSN